ncbi:MAG: nucleoside triphosphate pyrophosphohydrolase, partial [Alphaproteobacteria bacterium]
MTRIKLVRDRIPELIRNEGRKPRIKIVGGEELLNALNEKFQEEFNEYMIAKTEAEKLVELADVLEVVISTARHLGMTEQELLSLCHRKREDRGAFL